MSRKVSSSTLSIGILAIIVGLVGAYGVRLVMQQEEEAAPPEPKTFDIAMTITDIPAERVIAPGDLILRSGYTYEKLKELGIPSNLVIKKPELLIGRRTSKPIAASQAILSTDLYLEGTGPSLAEQLKPGERMVTIPVQATKGGIFAANTIVDVLFRSLPKDPEGGYPGVPEMTVTLLERVRVLETRESSPSDYRNGASLVTLAIPADKVSAIEAVEDHGDFSIVVRPENDLYSLSDEGHTTLNDVLGIKPLPEPEPETVIKPLLYRTVIYRGQDASVNTFVNQKQGIAVQVPKKPADDEECEECHKDTSSQNTTVPVPDYGVSKSTQSLNTSVREVADEPAEITVPTLAPKKEDK